MKKVFLACVMGIIMAFTGCSSSENEHKTDQTQVQKQQNEVKTENVKTKAVDQGLTQEAMEAKLNEIGIPIYPGAEFVDISFRHNINSVTYDIKPLTQESGEKVDQYYKPVFEKLKNNGWQKLLSIAEEPRFGKGDEEISFAHAFGKQAGIHRIIFLYSKKNKS